MGYRAEVRVCLGHAVSWAMTIKLKHMVKGRETKCGRERVSRRVNETVRGAQIRGTRKHKGWGVEQGCWAGCSQLAYKTNFLFMANEMKI